MLVPPAADRGGAEGAHVNVLPYALAAIRRGWYVFPCHANGKRPAVESWGASATVDEAQVRQWFETGDLNYGIATKASGLVVVDCDTKKELYEFPEEWRDDGVNSGDDVLAVLALAHGDTSHLETFSVQTPSGGWHYYFNAPQDIEITNSASRIGPLVDVRAAGGEYGGYVVGPGSSINGQQYKVANRAEVLELAPWLREAAAAPPRSAPAPTDAQPRGLAGPRVAGVLDWLRSPDAYNGVQNQAMFWGLCVFAAEGVPQQEAIDVVWPIVAHWPLTKPEPWLESHVEASARSAYSQPRI